MSDIKETIQEKIIDYYGTDKWMDYAINKIQHQTDDLSDITDLSEEEKLNYQEECKKIIKQLNQVKKTKEYINYKTEQLLLIQKLYSGLSDDNIFVPNHKFSTLSNMRNKLLKPENFINILNNPVVDSLINTQFKDSEKYREYMLFLFPEIKKINYNIKDILSIKEIGTRKFSAFEKSYEKFYNVMLPIRTKASSQYGEIIDEVINNQLVNLHFNYYSNTSHLNSPIAETLSQDFFERDIVSEFINMTNIQKQKYINSLDLVTYRVVARNFIYFVNVSKNRLEQLDEIKANLDINEINEVKNSLLTVERKDYIDFIKLWTKNLLSEENFDNSESVITTHNIIVSNSLEKNEMIDIVCECMYSLKEKNRDDLITKLFNNQDFSRHVRYQDFSQYCADINFDKVSQQNKYLFNVFEPKDIRRLKINLLDVEQLLGANYTDIFRLINSDTISILLEKKQEFEILIKYKGIDHVPLEKISVFLSELIKECREYTINADETVYKNIYEDNEEIMEAKLREFILNYLMEETKSNVSQVHKRRKV